MMATFEGGDGIATNGGDIHLGSAEHIREFTTVVSLPLGFRRLVRTREAIRLVPPNAIQFRHLAGPVRGLAEVISVEPLGEGRCRVTYDSVLPGSGLLLRLAYRMLARPAIQRIVRSHLADLFPWRVRAGLGASHQTGWTALLANLIDEIHRPVAGTARWGRRLA